MRHPRAQWRGRHPGDVWLAMAVAAVPLLVWTLADASAASAPGLPATAALPDALAAPLRWLGLASLSELAALAAVVALSALGILSLLALGALHRHLQAESDWLDGEVQRRTASLTELARHLQGAREDERHRLARDLHDELGALLTSAKLDAARIRSRLGNSQDASAVQALERLEHLNQTLDAVVALKRRIVEDLHPSALTHLGLPATLGILARELGERAGLAVHCQLAPVALGIEAQLVVYRVVQEAITNLSRHAQANQVWLRLGQQGSEVCASVQDDGLGFEADSEAAASGSQGGHGLPGMKLRVEAAGGRLALRSAPGEGTTVSCWLPANGPAPSGLPGEA